MSRHPNNFTELLFLFSAVFIVVMWSDAQSIPVSPLIARVATPRSVPVPKEPVTLLFAGDVMLGRYVGTLIAEHGGEYPFEKIAPDIQRRAPDFFIANLEGPITLLNAPDARVSPEQPYSMRFSFDPNVLTSLTYAGFTHLSLANNHIFDQGTVGAKETSAYLTSAGISPIGFRDGTALGTVSEVHKNGHGIALIGLDTTVIKHDQMELAHALSAFPSDTFVIVFVHWGNEYETTHSSEQEAFAHFLIDNGVDLIIGSHPHVVQDVGTYKGRAIFYSLGNFVFDQYWNSDVQTGLMVKVTLDDKVSYEEIPIQSIHSQPFVADQISL